MKRIFMLIVSFLLLLTCGCSSKNNKAAEIAAPSVADSGTMIELGAKENARHFLQIDINPSVIVGYTEDDTVVYIASINADGYKLLKKHQTDIAIGEPLDTALGSIMSAAHVDGYEAENFDVEIRFSGEEKGSAEDIVELTRQAVKVCDFDIKVVVEEKSEIVFDPDAGITETVECELCGGKGIRVCEDCNGAGERLVLVPYEQEVRNDYVCEVCGGKGWIDDGMHGGEIGNCDSCGGMEGKMPSGDFRAKAYDRVMVEEEELRRCEPCDGSGEVLCQQCGGEGKYEKHDIS